jgi:hypothetical protein
MHGQQNIKYITGCLFQRNMPYVEYTRGTDGEEMRRDDSGGKSCGLRTGKLHLWAPILVMDIFMFETHAIIIIFFFFIK